MRDGTVAVEGFREEELEATRLEAGAVRGFERVEGLTGLGEGLSGERIVVEVVQDGVEELLREVVEEIGGGVRWLFHVGWTR